MPRKLRAICFGVTLAVVFDSLLVQLGLLQAMPLDMYTPLLIGIILLDIIWYDGRSRFIRTTIIVRRTPPRTDRKPPPDRAHHGPSC